ncbi:MAG TPA: thioredoxin domain-containing protein [Holophagaceae bacterium]|nr:thioredoxin domain-containing protein [Holophagaceae bacterium]
MTNRLAQSLSPYLLQHAHNPVDWHPWGEEALAKAKAEDKPIFLSIGYSACHWCHVMERESFENPDVAEVLNAHFVPIKVDREERPDLDDLYMDAVQTLTGRGGWPMSVWLTPDLKPFYGGTYFPPLPRRGMPGFIPLLQRIAELWAKQRGEVRQQADELTAELERQVQVQPGSALPDVSALHAALEHLRRSFDAQWGGFGGAPKFPQQMAVELILRRGSPEDQRMATRTLDAMWEGGMYDHLGGGFARYSVDGQWLIPHFEKMLYDNAQLVSCYLLAFQKTGEPRYAEIARESLDYLLRDMRDEAGGLHSTEDADSEGEEGRFYVFTPEEVRQALGDRDGRRFCEAFGITEAGNFEHGSSAVHRFSRPADLDLNEAEDRDLRERLRAWRDRRVRPGKDDKILAAWNGLALTAFARGAQVLGDAHYLEAAEGIAGFLQKQLWDGGRLFRVYRHGERHTPGFLEDYAAVANGLVDLYEAGFDSRWLEWATALGEAMRERFEDRQDGAFFSTEASQGDLLFRQKPGFDNAVPSGNTLAAQALLRLSLHLEREDFRASAEGVLRTFAPWLHKAPRGFLGMASVLDLALREPLAIVVAGDLHEPRTQALFAEVHRRFLPHRVLSLVGADPDLPLNRGRGLFQGAPCAYVCRGQTCLAPVTRAEDLGALLDTR